MRHLLLLFAAHFVLDASLSVLAPLLPLLVELRGLSVTLAASLVSVQSVVFGLAQPALGHLADVVRQGWVLPAALLLAGAATVALGAFTSYAGLAVAVGAASVASGLFHALSAILVRGVSYERAGLLLSVHTFIGTAGVAVAPVIAIALMKGSFLGGLAVMGGLLAALGGAATLTGTHRLDPKPAPAARPTEPIDEPSPRTARLQAKHLTLLALGLLFKVQVDTALRVYLPLYYAGRPEGAAFGNVMLTVFLVSSAAATLAFGYLSDRVGRKRVTLAAQVIAPFPILGFLTAPTAWAPFFLTLSALALSATTAAGVVYAQELMPRRPALAASIIIGFIAGIAGVAITPLGALGERIGLGTVLWGLAWLPLAGVPLLARLPETRAARPAPSPQTSG